MITTSTNFLHNLLEGKTNGNKTSENTLNKNEELFYELIKPSLNKLVKQPKQETINKILVYSKSL
ncbi:MAG: hypothetical protein EAZ51_00860 [Sphingobacteriales bacterium]|nr:MAG: hypothetical protein EAZ51_00860 [Sphingobacteriales bacterium]